MGTRIFTYAEAVALLPQVRHLTAAAHGRVEALRTDIDGTETPEIEGQIEAIFSDWARAMDDLGLEVKGPWLVDFDNGSGYYCWRHPEPGLHFFHTYEAGFGGRVPVQ